MMWNGGYINMNNEQLMDMKEKLLSIPMLNNKATALKEKVLDAEATLNKMKAKYTSEQYDVERLEKDSFSTLIIKLFGKYDDKLEKEMNEMLHAKIELDEAFTQLDSLERELSLVNTRLSELKRYKFTYEEELRKREEEIKSKLDSKYYGKYQLLSNEIDFSYNQKIEIEEALTAAKRAKNVAESAMVHLDKAEGIATYDVWFKGGILVHMAKYEQIDEAELYMNSLSSCLKNLQKELQDIQYKDAPRLTEISSTERAMDFWFDNIFTDLNVRDKIRGNIEEVRNIIRKIETIIGKLTNRKDDMIRQIVQLEERKESLLLSI